MNCILNCDGLRQFYSTHIIQCTIIKNWYNRARNSLGCASLKVHKSRGVKETSFIIKITKQRYLCVHMEIETTPVGHGMLSKHCHLKCNQETYCIKKTISHVLIYLW